MKHVFKKAIVSVMLLVVVFVLSACGKSDRLVVNVGPNPNTIDPALNSAVDGATMIIHAFTGLVGYKQNEQGGLVLVPQLAKALPTPEDVDGTKVKYVFELRDNLKWSDGSELTAKDFEYAWKRAASRELGADYSYMFDVIDGFSYEEDEEVNLNVTAEGNKLTVVLKNDVPYFFELCAFPAYMPVKQSVVEGAIEGDDPDEGQWATKVETYIGNGPFRMVEWEQHLKIVFEKNPYYYEADEIKLDEIEFALSDDDNAILANYKNGTYKLIDTVPNDEIDTLRTEYPNEFVVAGQLGTYYLNFNVADNTIYGTIATTEDERAKVRKALSLLIDRNYIAEEIGQTGQQPANSFIPIGLTEPDGKTEFVEKNGPNGDGAGYYSVDPDDYEDNCAEAVALLREVGYAFNETENKFTDFPTFNYILNTGTGHEAIANYLVELYAGYGIPMTTQATQEWQTFLDTRKNGDYVFARNGWLGDYNDPISFLDMWLSTSGNNDVQFGKGSHATVKNYGPNKDKTWAETYDVLINEVKSSTDPAVRFAKMHQAENMLMESGAIVPIYFYTDLYMISPSITGFFASPLGFKYFMYCEYAK